MNVVLRFSEADSRYSNTRGVIDIKSLPGTVNPKHKDLVYNFPTSVQQQPAVTKKYDEMAAYKDENYCVELKLCCFLPTGEQLPKLHNQS